MPKRKIIPGRNYGSIPHLLDSKLGEHDRYLHEGQDRIIRAGGRDRHDEVIVSLKLDGTNVGVVKLGGELISLQRKGFGCLDSPYRQHHEFDKWMNENCDRFDDLLAEGERVVGEWLWQASGIRYTISGEAFVPFDIFRADGRRLPWSDLLVKLKSQAFIPPPSARYNRKSEPKFDHQALKDACHAVPETEHEGLIYRVERKGEFDYIAKWVRADYVAGRYLPGVREGAPEEITINRFNVP